MMQYQEYFAGLKGKTIGVFGMGISNIPLISMLLDCGAKVVAGDKKTKAQLGAVADDLEKRGVELVLGDAFPDNMHGEIIFRTPGIRPDIPKFLELKASGSIITSEMEVFFDLCPAEIIAVTGSDGKTTTTTLISEMLKAEGYKVWLGGNIGKPLLPDIAQVKENDKVVVELSSFQLMTFKKSPHIAVMTNLSPNHLDVHKDYQEYIDAKKNIMLYQSESDIFVTNAGNADTLKVSEQAKGVLRTFSSQGDALLHLKNGVIYYGEEAVLDTADIKLPGNHNVENYMTAIGAVHDLVSRESIVKVAKDFGGVPHRIELVRTLDGVRYYNSSIDSSPNRTINTLKVFPQKVILIAGGKDKGIAYDDIGPAIAEHVKCLLLIGATSDAIESAVRKAENGDKVEILRFTTYEDVVKTAREKAENGDVVLLSNASTSFDMFKNFEERGNLFKELVMNL